LANKTDKELQKGKFANNHKSPEKTAQTKKTEKPKRKTPKQEKTVCMHMPKAKELDPIIKAKIKPPNPYI